MSTGMHKADMEDLMPDCACIPRNFMTYLIEEQLVGTSADIHLISTNDVTVIHDMYAETYAEDT